MTNTKFKYTIADRYVDSSTYKAVFGSSKLWPADRWIHLVHNWRTGGSSLTALLSVNFHDSYLKVGHPFTRDGWPVDYGLNPFQVTEASQLSAWIKHQAKSAILAGHTYYGMAPQLGISDFDLWVTMREPAARLNSGLLRFHRKPLKSSHPQGGYIGDTKGHSFSSAFEIEQFATSEMAHELNGMCRRIAGYSMSNPDNHTDPSDDLESSKSLDTRPVDQACFETALSHLESGSWIYLTEYVLPSILLLEYTYDLKPLIHPCSHLVHNPQWNGAGITRLQESLLINYRSLLESLNKWDVKLYARANQIFWKRWKELDIDPARLEARRILQSKPLIHPQKLRNGELARKEITARIEHRSKNARTKDIAKWILEDGFKATFWSA